MNKAIPSILGSAILALSINVNAIEIPNNPGFDMPAGGALPTVFVKKETNKPNYDQLRAYTRMKEKGMNVVDVGKGPVPGWRSVYVNDTFAVIDTSGKNLYLGSMIDTDSMIDKIQDTKLSFDIKKLKAFDHKVVITYPAHSEYANNPRATMYVFTDTSCPYCSLQHEGVDELNANGVEVKYIPFMRGFPKDTAPGFTSMNDVWCREGEDRKERLHAWKTSRKMKKEPSNIQSCETSMEILAKGHKLGSQLGVRGTPHSVIEVHGNKSGVMVQNGFAPAGRTLRSINVMFK